MTDKEIRSESLELLKKLRPIDDTFMREMFRNNIDLTEFILRLITEIPDLVITKVDTQYDLHRLVGVRSANIDVHGTDSKNSKYSLEIERSDKRASPYRSRFLSSAVDVEYLDQGDDFTALPVSYVIFITENDIFGKGQLVHRIERIDVTTGEPFNDGEHIIYLNSSYKPKDGEDISELAKLAHDFLCSDPDEMYLPIMAKTAKYYKTSEKGVEHMCQLVDELIAKHEVAKANEFATKLIARGKQTLEEIAEDSGLSLDEVKALAAKANQPPNNYVIGQ